MAKNLSPAAFLAVINQDTRTATDIDNASCTLKRSAYQAALWVWTRTATDGADGATVSTEAGVTEGRISQIKAGMRLMLDSGIPLPTDVAEAAACETTYLIISATYKSGKAARARLKEAVKRAESIADVDGKHSVLSAVLPDEKETRAPRVNNGTSATADDTNNNGAPAVGGTAPTETASTLVERMRSVLADIQGGPVADIETVLTLANEISDAIVARAEGAALVE